MLKQSPNVPPGVVQAQLVDAVLGGLGFAFTPNIGRTDRGDDNEDKFRPDEARDLNVGRDRALAR
ncbi:hypothetical protein SAMN05192544_11134 [Paraburkholderia hospita]|jgi:hypothetical protein|nr:hypothetical protein SAMN05192544_11134 [Paraburkholderia hospita]